MPINTGKSRIKGCRTDRGKTMADNAEGNLDAWLDHEEEDVQPETPEEPEEQEGNDKDDEEEDDMVSPSLDDLDDVAPKEKSSIVTPDTKVEDGMVLTIKDVSLSPPLTKDFEGKSMWTDTGNGGYYKGKVNLFFEEQVDGKNIRQGIPSIFYGTDKRGKLQNNGRPNVPKACPDDKLGDRMTSTIAKLRNLYCKHVGKDPKEVSDKEFIQGLKGKKVRVEKETGDFKGRRFAVLRVTEFV